MPVPPDPPRRSLAAAGAPASGLQPLQGAVILVAVLYFARELLIPLALAVLLSFVLAPVVRLFRRLSVPRVAAVLLATLIACMAVLGVGAIMGQQATSLAHNLPAYQASIAQKLASLQSAGGLVDRINAAIGELGRTIRQTETPPGATAPAAAPPVLRGGSPAEPQPLPVEIRRPAPTPFETLEQVIVPLLGPLALTGIVLILVIFILLYREDLRDRVIRLVGSHDLHRTMAAMDDAAYRLSRYFLSQVALNSAYGMLMAAALWLIGIPNPLLWGFVTGLMRFVPFVGGFIAAAFPALLALAVDPGWTTLLIVVVLFAITEALMGQVVEPLVFGHSTGLSPIAVIAAATFWTWLWGPVGLLLSVPLTVCLVVLGRHVDRLEFLEVMLGDQPALEPEEFFYQRALAGDADALDEQAAGMLKERRLADYLDRVALPALRLAQADVARDTLSSSRLEVVRQSVLTLIEDLEGEDEAVESEAPPLPDGWQAPGAVLCLSGRGPFDELLAAMLAEILRRRGFGVQQAAAGAAAEAVAGAPPRLFCLCLIEGGSSAATARYLLRRARRRLPGVPALALAWQPEDGEGTLAAALRSESATVPLLVATGLAEAGELAAEAAITAPAAAGPAPAPARAASPSGAGTAPAPA